MAAEDRYVLLTEAEMDSPAFRACRGAAFKVYMVLRRMANWKTGIGEGAFSFIARRVGVTRCNIWQQMRRLERQGLLKFIRCHPGREKAGDIVAGRRQFTQWQVFGFDGAPFSSYRNRNDNDSESIRYRRENETNTNKEDRDPPTTMRGEGKDPPSSEETIQYVRPSSEADTTVDTAASIAFLRQLGVRGRVVEELTGIASLKKLRAAWEVTKTANHRGKIKANPGEDPGEGLTRYFIGTVRNQFKSQIPPSSPETEHTHNARGTGRAGRAGARVDSEVEPGVKRPANRPPRASDSGENAKNGNLATKEDFTDLRKRYAAARRGTATRIGDVL